MKKSYRLHMEDLYVQALKSVRVQAKKVTAHKDASATIASNEKTAEAVKKIPGVELLNDGKTELTFRIPAAVEWHNQNPPNFTADERAAAEAERAARKAAREAKLASQVEGDGGDDPETDDEAEDEQSE